jgi:gentisate 1,2-dioxygenase
MWPDGWGDPIRYDWEVGRLIVAPGAIYHQHFNTGATPGRYLAFKYRGSPRNSQGVLLCFISKRQGGDQLDYADETPHFRKLFADELSRPTGKNWRPCRRKSVDVSLPILMRHCYKAGS